VQVVEERDWPPDDGWCIRIASGDGGYTLQAWLFDTRDEALKAGTTHAWHHRDEVVWLIERQRGQTMSERELTLTRPPIDLEVWQELEVLEMNGYEVVFRATSGNIGVGPHGAPPPRGPSIAIRGANTAVFGGGGESNTATEAAKEALARWYATAPPDEPPARAEG
jgi:hypothetical protein